MSVTTNRDSSLFPEGYGDLAIKSSDGIVCHFGSQILGHMSPVFKDMLQLGENKDNYGPVEITETITSLELFLQHLDPRVIKPPIDATTIRGLISMAHKYQTDTVMQWFEQEATCRRINLDGSIQEPFAIQEPVISLSLAYQYGLPNTGRCALRELCEFDSQRLQAIAPQIGLSAFLDILKLQAARVRRYQVWIDILAKHRPSGEYIYQRDGDVPRFWVNKTWMIPCTACVAQRAHWVLGIANAIQLRPSWSTFINAYESNSAHCFPWSNFFEDLVPAWEEAALREESQLPEWAGPTGW